MEQKRVISLMVLMLSTFVMPEARAFWVWTPQTNRWVNPRYEPKGSPQEQFDWAMTFYEEKNYKEAFKEFKKLVRAYPRSELAPRALLYAGDCREKEADYSKAFDEYQRIIEEYPGSGNIDEVIGRQFKTGEMVLETKEKKILGVEWNSFLATERALEIFRKIIENAPYGTYADKAQFKLGLIFEKAKRYEEALAEYKKLLKKYPESDLAEGTKYRIGLCSYAFSLPSDYDNKATAEARKSFEDFVKQHPESPLKKEIEQNLTELVAKESRKTYDIARFYEQQGNLEGALIYYQEIIDKYPQSKWVDDARRRIEQIKQRQGKK